MILPDNVVILLAEDISDDVFLIRRALDQAGVKNALHVVRDGEECLAYLHGDGKYANRLEYPMPHILLFDLKMPRLDGFGVLRALRSDKAFAPLRIIVLTSSDQVFDINKTYELGANSFLIKPLEIENLSAMMATLRSFWLHPSHKLLAPIPPNDPNLPNRSEERRV